MLLGAALAVTVTLAACSDDDQKKPDLSVDTSVQPDVTADIPLADQAQPDQAQPDQAQPDQTLDTLPDKGPKSDAAVGCGSITDVGCCDGTTVKFCIKGVLKSLDCSKQPKCGWDSTYSYYDCGTSGGTDPKGKYPKSCSGKPADLGPATDTGVPDIGTSDTGASDTGAADYGSVDSGSKPCGSVTFEGCCDGSTLKYCDSGKLETLDCSKQPKCGWNSTASFYDCGTSGGADPSGKYPRACKGGSADIGVKDAGPAPDGAASDGSTKDTGPLPDGAASAKGIVITEMLINPKAVGDAKGEWFELYNAGTAAVNLHGWTITDKPGSSQNKHTISATGGKLMIQPGKYLVLGKSTNTATNGNVPVAYAYGKSTWDLGNGGDEIYLHDASKKLVDKVEYTKSWTIPNGASLSLKDPSLGNNSSKNWCAEKTKWCSTCDMGTPGKKAGCK